MVRRFPNPLTTNLRISTMISCFDWRLYHADIRGSIAYAKALARANIITDSERNTLIDGLQRVMQEFDARTFEAKPSDEDIHTAVERRLGELVGTVAGKCTPGAVATIKSPLILACSSRTPFNLQSSISNLQSAISEKSEQRPDVLMPGYTHLQRAQPILFAHWLMSYFWMLQRDHARFAVCAERVSVLPLGSGALAGNALGN